MTEKERLFIEAAGKVIYRYWWLQNKTLADCPYPNCSGMGATTSDGWPDPDDGVSYGHDPDCELKDAILAYWAMREAEQAA